MGYGLCYDGAMNRQQRAPERERVAMLVALPKRVWDRIRVEARDLGVGPSKLIEPILLQAFGDVRDSDT